MKTPVVILALSLIVPTLHAQITPGNPEVDQFANATGSGGSAYTAGSNLVGQTNAQGQVWIGAGNATAQPVITNNNLIVPGLLPSTGNAVNFGGASTGTTAVLPLTGKAKILGTNVNFPVYYSMAFQINNLGTLTASPIFVAGFEEGVTETGQTGQPGNVGARLYLCKNGSGFNFGMNKSDGSTTPADIVWEGGATNGATYNVGTTYFVVASYTFTGTEGDGLDSVSLWINPSSSTFGGAAPTPDITTTFGSNLVGNNANDQIWGFELREGNANEPSSMTVDELSIGVTWADVTPTAPSLVSSFSNLTTPSPVTYGSTVTLSGTLSASGPVYPPTNETVYVSINGNQQTTTISDTTGDFSIKYNANAPTNATPYTISYVYLGDSTFTGATNTSTTLTVNSALPVVLSGSRMFDGTATATAGMLFVSNRVAGDTLTLGGASATLAGSTAGVEAITDASTLTLGGASAVNYTLTGASGAVTIATPPLAAGSPAFDPFADASGSGGTSYAVSADLVGQTNAQGLPWVAAGNGTGQPVVASGTLVVPGLIADTGNSITYGGFNNGTSAQLDFSATTSKSVFFGGSAYSVYYSMSFMVTDTNGLSTNTPAIVAGFNNTAGSQTNSPTSIGARLYTRAATNAPGYNIGINKADGTSNDIAWETNVYTANTTNFIVAAYTFSGTAGVSNDTVALWVNPNRATFGAASAPTNDPAYVTTSGGPNIGNNSTADKIGGFLLREQSTLEPAAITVDEVSVGVNWADVTPTGNVAPSPIPLTVTRLAGSVVLSWTTNNSSAFRLEGRPTLSGGSGAWTNVTATKTMVGANYTVTDPISGKNYYRLIYP